MWKIAIPIIIGAIIIGLLIFLVVRHNKEKYIDLAGEWWLNDGSNNGSFPVILDSSGKGYVSAGGKYVSPITVDLDNNTVTMAPYDDKPETYPITSVNPGLITISHKDHYNITLTKST